MGFSVSGATVVIFLGLFISFGIAYSAANNGMERVNDAYEENTEDALARQNTAIAIGNASVANEGGDLYLNVTVNNTGSTTLSTDDTDILIDGNYTNHTSSRMETFEVVGSDETDIWLPGETFRFNVSVATRPDRVKVVTGPGVADSEVV
ncbi:fla cluster protein FlaF [Halorussus gelatinilyticus]|uniref:Fla cluster protein FlaF n=1 Tax=Halorussus gelatinilyticus TaxID=2937524 RepID=A0A8U0IIE0_9EURY|nr:fla cluster protein FlaF [Halorussus gelatinilyticus]UPW00431.1 fla cluster protein FlaF [Halorussus gelatinilyticus]